MIVNNNPNLINRAAVSTVDVLSQYNSGKFRFISKVKAGFMTIVDARDFENKTYMQHPEEILRRFQKNALQTVEFCPEGSEAWLTVFARSGKKIHFIDKTILVDLTVGTINSLFLDTTLYNQNQYAMVDAKTWACKAFVSNRVAEVENC